MLLATEQLHSQRSAADFVNQIDPLHEESCLQVLPIAADDQHQTVTTLSCEVFPICIPLCEVASRLSMFHVLALLLHHIPLYVGAECAP